MKPTWWCALALLFLAPLAYAETPETVTGGGAYFAVERVMSSEGPAVDEAAAVLFGQAGFGSLGVGGWGMATGTFNPGQIDVQRVRVIELAVASHYYLAQGNGVAVGPTAWLQGTYGYESGGTPLVKRSPAGWGLGARFGGHGAWGLVGWGTHEMVGPHVVMAMAHLPIGDRAALNGDLVTNGAHYQLRLRALVGWN